jgi:membrane associated rhomboid family serine protease
MANVELGGAGSAFALDLCAPCQIVWFDPTEYRRAAQPAPPPLPPSGEAGTPGPDDDGPGFALTGPDSAWQIIPAILGMPIEYGPNRLRERPIVTWSLVLVMAAVLVIILLRGGSSLLDKVIADWGLVPARWGRHVGLTILTAFFLHAGWWHLIGNAYFLAVFGDNVEDHLGWAWFVVLIFASHVGGMWLQGLLGADPNVPCVGASAGISGIIAYYAVVFPRAKVGVFLWLLTLFRFLRMPAMVGLLLYAGLQAIMAYMTRDEPTGVAYLAHLGGLAVGALAGVVGVTVRQQRRP